MSHGPIARDRIAAALDTALGAAARARELLDAPAVLREEIRLAYEDGNHARLLAELDTVDVQVLGTLGPEPLRIAALVGAGMGTVADVLRADPETLDGLPGIGPVNAAATRGAARRVAAARAAVLPVAIDWDATTPASTRLATALYALDSARALAARSEDTAREIVAGVEDARERARPATTWWRWILASPSARRRAREAATDLDDLAERCRAEGVDECVRTIAAMRSQHPEVARADLRSRRARYVALLESVIGGLAPGHGALPADLVARVGAHDLDTTRLRAVLRPYQEFGARYALAQRRAILGDEMGLGKTVQALAVAAHVVEREGGRILVVCPAGLVVTWAREVVAHTDLAPAVVYGPGAGEARERWRRDGGIAVVPYTGLNGGTGFGDLDLLVVDEAHYVKNPKTRRSRAVAALAASSGRVVLLTGTPMENRVAEFRSLVHHLAPAVAEGIDPVAGAAGADAFRHAVAPVYLRRNQEDVLRELPEIIQVDVWEELGVVDGAAYRRAVESGSFPAMRRAAFDVARARESAKAVGLVEIVEEALAAERKVVVFSYFRDVVRLVTRALGDRAIGALTGSVGASARQEMIDAFVASERATVLVSQIDVGGVGLNLQAASVVVLCEPQTKPTAEHQAVARVHRMGQVEAVRVYRLLAADTVDEEMVRILRAKESLFDAYARHSVVADAAMPETALARRLVASERARLDAAGTPWGTRDVVADGNDPTGTRDAVVDGAGTEPRGHP